ncbi:MAG: hypothetical protein WAK17_17150 [Candidatus Nitrosopolaris sp.]
MLSKLRTVGPTGYIKVVSIAVSLLLIALGIRNPPSLLIGGGIWLIMVLGWAKDSLDIVDKVVESLKRTSTRQTVDTRFLLVKLGHIIAI